MIKSYLTIAWRSLIRNKGYALINICGLAIGMTVAMLIGLFVYDELTWNKQFKNYDRIARVLVNASNSHGWYQQWGTATLLAGEIRSSYGGLFDHVLLSSQNMSAVLSNGETKVTQSGYYFEPGIADMLSFEMISGSRDAFANPASIMLSESAAKALFGSADAFNKSITMDGHTELIVTGVFRDMPDNSDFGGMRFVLPWQLAVQNNYNNNNGNQWNHNGFVTWAQISAKADMSDVTTRIKDVMLKSVGPDSDKPQLYLHPMSRWHLYSDFESATYATGRIRYVRLYGSIGGFVLLIACINFMNLATARSERRAKEVGIRKSVGSARRQLIGQFFSESLLVTMLAFALALLITQLAVPYFSIIAQKQIHIPWSNPVFWGFGLAFVIFTGICAGSYPALYLSSFQPAKVLKSISSSTRSGSLPRKILVVIQFSVSITLIIGVTVVFRQIEFGKHRSVGYDQDRLIYVWTRTREIHNHYDAIRHELLNAGVVSATAESLHTPTHVAFHNGGYEWEGMTGDGGPFGVAWVSPEFGKTMGWEFIEGRDFSHDIASDSSAIVLNESAVKFMRLEDPIGKTIRSTIFDKTTSHTVIGVIRDMLQESPFEPIGKTIYRFDNGMWSKNGGSLVNLRINSGMDTREALERIKHVWQKYDAASPFDYAFVDDDYANKFSEEERVARLAFVFAVIAIAISCLGILGLASYMAEQRTREIGIRKVLGASVANLWQLLSKDFVILVMISSAMAVPPAWYFMNGWLQNYTYRTTLSWYIFLATVLGALGITLMTVSYQAIKAAIANPVRSLRSE